MSHTIITRTGFCPICEKEHRPHTGNKFLVYGSSANCYHVRVAQRIGEYGFVPQIYKILKVDGKFVLTERACAMYNCGVDRRLDEHDMWFYFVRPNAWTRETFVISAWNALVVYHDSNYTV